MTSLPRRIHDRHTGKTINLTGHAIKRAEQMSVGAELIAKAALLPDVRYRGNSDFGLIQRCDDSPIAIVFDPDSSTVITVLWNSPDTYVRPDKKASA